MKLTITNTRCLPSKITQYKTYRPGYELEVEIKDGEEIDWEGLRDLIEKQLDEYETLIYTTEETRRGEKNNA